MNANPKETSANFSYSCGDYRVFRITASDPESMRYLPHLHIRALQFINKYGAETDPVFLAKLLYGDLRSAENGNLVHVLVAVLGDEIKAHSISYVDQYQRLNVVIQMQVERDKSIPFNVAKDIHDLGLNLIEDWARSLKLKTIIAYTLKPSITRLDQRDGFKVFRTVVRKDLEG